MAGANAHADTEAFNLTGSLAGFQYVPASNGESGYIPLSGVNSTVVSPGDTLSISVALDGPLAVPAGTDFSYVAVDFSGPDFDGTPVSLSDDLTFYRSGVEVAAFSGTYSSTSSQLATDAIFFNQPLYFDSLTATSQVLTLDAPVTVTGASLSVGAYNNGVPEPSTWFLMIAGIGGVGLMMRRATIGTRLRFEEALKA
jgi:hypothetical protein